MDANKIIDKRINPNIAKNIDHNMAENIAQKERILELQPKEVFYYFNEISKIPHGSGNTEKLQKYCIHFAKSHGLSYFRDECGNVMIFKEGTPGSEASEPVILQGHLDMVCEKTIDCTKDMEREPIELETDGEFLWAKNTTLGGDDGIAIAYILAILASKEIEHPPLEALFTVDEEVGLVGATKLDASHLRGKRLINIDSEEEGILTVSCAGAARVLCTFPVTMEEIGRRENSEQTENSGQAADLEPIEDVEETADAGQVTVPEQTMVRFKVSGLRGGHSGIEINDHRKNAIKVLGELLDWIFAQVEFQLVDLGGGKRLNVIPGFAEATICLNTDRSERKTADLDKLESVKRCVDEYVSMVKKACQTTEPELAIAMEIIGSADTIDLVEEISIKNTQPALSFESTKAIIFALMQAPNGVYAMSSEMEGMVETSLNLGEVKLERKYGQADNKDVIYVKDKQVDEDERKQMDMIGQISMGFMVRSNVDYGKKMLVRQLILLTEQLNGQVKLDSDYPAWEYRVDSPLRDQMVRAHEEMYGEKPEVCAIHAGLECGIISLKIENADMVSIGPNMKNVHSPAEILDVKSVERTYQYLMKILGMLR